MKIEWCSGCKVVNHLDVALNDMVLRETAFHYHEQGETGLSTLPMAARWYSQMRNRRSEAPQEKTDSIVSYFSRLGLAWKILKEQTPTAAKEIKDYFAIIKSSTIEDRAVLTFLIAYKIFYSPLNQAGRMLDHEKCQRECSIGFAKWYVWARMTLNLKPIQALEFACTALMAKCEGLSQSGTGVKTIAIWYQ